MMVSIADRLFTERKSSSETSAVSSLSAQSLLMIVDAFRAVQKHVSPMKIYLFICVFSEHRFTPAFCFFLPGWFLFDAFTNTHSIFHISPSVCLSFSHTSLSSHSFLLLSPSADLHVQCSLSSFFVLLLLLLKGFPILDFSHSFLWSLQVSGGVVIIHNLFFCTFNNQISD